MARKGREKALAGQGLSAGGAVAQGDIAQSVITQGALGESRQQEQALRADIERRMTEAQMLRDQGIATAQSEADITMLQNRLNELDTLEAKKVANEAQAKADYLATIGQFYGDYQAEINRVKNDGDPSNDWQLPFLQQARQEKIANQGLDQQGKVIDQGITYSVSQALEATRQGMWNQQIADALGMPFTEASRMQISRSGGGGSVAPTEEPISTTDIGTYKNYNLMKDLFTQGRVSDAEAIEYISQNEQALIAKFGEQAVAQMWAELNEVPEEVVEEEIVEPVEEPKAEANKIYLDYVKRYLEDEDKNIIEDEFIKYLERISVSDPEGAEEIARVYGYQSY